MLKSRAYTVFMYLQYEYYVYVDTTQQEIGIGRNYFGHSKHQAFQASCKQGRPQNPATGQGLKLPRSISTITYSTSNK
jgi:hypothetical protein